MVKELTWLVQLSVTTSSVSFFIQATWILEISYTARCFYRVFNLFW